MTLLSGCFHQPNLSVSKTCNPSYKIYNGDIINTIDSNCNKQGNWIYFGIDKSLPEYKDSSIVSFGTYINDRKYGIWTKYYPSGVVHSEITIENNRPKGKYILYFENGCKDHEGYWTNSLDNETYYSEIECNKVVDPELRSIKKSTNYSFHNFPFNEDNPYFLLEKDTNIRFSGDTILYDEYGNITWDGIFNNGIFWEGKRYLYTNENKLVSIDVFKKGLCKGELYPEE